MRTCECVPSSKYERNFPRNIKQVKRKGQRTLLEAPLIERQGDKIHKVISMQTRTMTQVGDVALIIVICSYELLYACVHVFVFACQFVCEM